MVEEKRRYIRWKKKARIAYAFLAQPEVYQDAFTEDVSDHGVQILVNKKLEPEQKVKLKLEFVYDTVPITILAKVVYLKTYPGFNRVGLEFVNMDDFQRQRLRRCLDIIRQDSQGLGE